MNTKHQEALNILVDLHADFIKAARPTFNKTEWGLYASEFASILSCIMETQQAINLVSTDRAADAADIVEKYAEKFEKSAAHSFKNSQKKVGFFAQTKGFVEDAKADFEYEDHAAKRLRNVLKLIR